MSRRSPASFRQRDLTAALRAARAAGLVVQRVEVSGGRIVMVTSTGEASSPDESSSPGTDLDRELSEWEARRDR